MSFVKKIATSLFLSVFVFLIAATPSLSLAQTQKTPEKPTVVAPDSAPLIVKINNIAYSSQKRVISIDFTATNNTNAFVDTLKYNFEFYNGDKLEKTGLMFRNLNYIISTSGAVEKLSPNQSRRQTIEYSLPENIPGGNYFIRGVLSNNSLSVYGVDYTKESIKLTGRGGFIINKFAGLLDLKNKQVYNLMEGPTLERDGDYIVAFPAEMNNEIFTYLKSKEIYSNLTITHISNSEEVVYEKKNIPLSSLMNKEKTGLDFKIEPWENMRSGSHTAVISFEDEKGVKLSESMSVRLLYRGLLGRIYNIDTNINSYKKGQPANLLVNVVVAGDPSAEKVFVNAKFKNNGEVIQEIQKEVKLNKDFNGVDVDVDFSDKNIKTKTLINEVEINMVTVDGIVLDSQSIEIDTNEVFEYPKSSNVALNILIGILVVASLIAFLAFLKRKNKIHLAALILGVSIVSGSILMSFTGTALAQYEPYCADPAADNPYTSSECTYNNSNQNYQPYCNDPSADYPYTSGECTYNNQNNRPYCSDTTADNYNTYEACTYNNSNPANCTDPTATNLGQDLPCIYQGQNGNVVGCQDPNALNYGDPAGGCVYAPYDQGGICDDPYAWNFGLNEACVYPPEEGEICEEEGASNFGEEGECEYNDQNIPQLTRDLINLYSSTNPPNSEICTENCVDMTYYLRIQCKDCLNAAHNIEVKYFNNWKGSALNSPSDKNLYFNFDNKTYPNVFSAWTVFDEDLEKDFAVDDNLKISQNAKLAGTPIAANDIVNQWIFGPFGFSYCSENFNEDGSIDAGKSDPDGAYRQKYAIEVATSFGGDYCKADVDGTEYGPAYEVTVEDVSCKAPAELRGSFYIDHNNDGKKNADELYLKSSSSTPSCLGEESPLKGLVKSLIGNPSYGNLTPDNCFENNIPYFFKDLLIPGDWKIGIDPSRSFGFVTTGIQYLINSIWVSGDSINLVSGDVVNARIGVKANNGTSISCVANPSNPKTFPVGVSWNASLVSSEYDIEDLILEWTEINAINKNPSTIQKSGGLNLGRYDTFYNNSTGGARDYSVKVVAKNNEGEVVSNEATCTVEIDIMEAICRAYPSLQAIPDYPAQYFDYGQDVYWNVFLKNADPSIESIVWGGAAYSGGSNDNYTVGSFNYYTRGQQQIANVTVRGSSGTETTAICPIFIKQCTVDSECNSGNICNQSTFTCVIPPPEIEFLSLANNGIVNSGEKCQLSWTVTGAESCILYRNGVAVDYPGSNEVSNSIPVLPGTYSIICENSSDPVIRAVGGPVKCLVNPNIREK